MAVFKTNVFSMFLKQNMDVTIILPEGLKEGEKLKTIWLYHGSSGDHTGWLYHTKIVEYVKEYHFAVVLPNVHESCFVDMNIGRKYGSYVGKELVSTIQQMFPVMSAERKDNYVSGFSNGGYGCLHVALSNPDTFSVVGAFSAGDKADSDFANDGSAKSIGRIRLFGSGDLNENAYGLKYLAQKLIDENLQRPIIYHACGSEDPWLDKNEILRDFFLAHGEQFDYTYDQIEGAGHTWEFWEEEFVRFLHFLGMKGMEEEK